MGPTVALKDITNIKRCRDGTQKASYTVSQQEPHIIDVVFDVVKIEMEYEMEHEKKVMTSFSRYIEFYIENKNVGTLIGKQGSNIKKIETYTCCKIKIHDGKCGYDGAKRGMIYDGSGYQCYMARKMIQTLVPGCHWQ